MAERSYHDLKNLKLGKKIFQALKCLQNNFGCDVSVQVVNKSVPKGRNRRIFSEEERARIRQRMKEY